MYIRRLPKFEYLIPKTVEEACELLYKHKGEAKVIAGGTDLLINMKKRQVVPKYLIELGNLTELNYIRHNEKKVLSIGALATHQMVADSPLVKETIGLLADACRKVGTPQIRNMGTIGGNLSNAGPSADTAPPLLSLEAKLTLVCSQGERIVPIDGFFTGPFTTIMKDDELLTEIQIPCFPQMLGSYQWLTKITTIDETLVGVAVVTDSGACNDIRISLCSVAPVPFRVKKAEAVLRYKGLTQKLIAEAAEVAATEATPRSRSNYRRNMIALLVKRVLSDILRDIESKE